MSPSPTRAEHQLQDLECGIGECRDDSGGCEPHDEATIARGIALSRISRTTRGHESEQGGNENRNKKQDDG